MNNELKSYIAGFLDGDGSIHVRIKPNLTYKYGFQISPNIVFYQSMKESSYMRWIQKKLKVGYLRERKDGIIELTIGDRKSLLWLIDEITPYLKLKKSQAKLMKTILLTQKDVKTAKDFLQLCKKIDSFEKLNYSKKRKYNSLYVEKILKKEGLLTP
jgi:hypothetical protein